MPSPLPLQHVERKGDHRTIFTTGMKQAGANGEAHRLGVPHITRTADKATGQRCIQHRERPHRHHRPDKQDARPHAARQTAFITRVRRASHQVVVARINTRCQREGAVFLPSVRWDRRVRVARPPPHRSVHTVRPCSAQPTLRQRFAGTGRRPVGVGLWERSYSIIPPIPACGRCRKIGKNLSPALRFW